MNLYSFADFLQHYSKMHDLTPSQFERLLISSGLELGRDTLRKWMKGHRIPRPFTMTKVVRGLGGQTIILPSGIIMVVYDSASANLAYTPTDQLSNNLDNSGGVI